MSRALTAPPVTAWRTALFVTHLAMGMALMLPALAITGAWSPRGLLGAAGFIPIALGAVVGALALVSLWLVRGLRSAVPRDPTAVM